MKGRPVPPALIGVVWFGCGSPCSWNRYQMAHEHYNRSNFPNIFNFHRTETDPGVRQQNRALCQRFQNVNDLDQKELHRRLTFVFSESFSNAAFEG